MLALPRLLLLALLAASAVSCSSDVAPGEKAAPAQQKHPTGGTPQDARLSSLEDKYKKLESMAQAHPRDKDYILSEIDDFQKDAVGTEYAGKAGKLAGEVSRRFEEDARATYEKMAAQAKKLVNEKKYGGALELLGEYPEEFSATQWKMKIDKMIEPLEAEIKAEDRLTGILADVENLKDKSPEAAMRRLNEYPEYLRKGRRKEEWERVHSELASKVEAIEEQRRQEAALPWEDLFTGGDMSKWSKGAGNWEVRDGCIVGTYQGPEGTAGQICHGSESSPWDNLIVELEFKVASGDYFVLGVRGKNVPGQGSTFAQIAFPSDKFPHGKFHDVTVEIRGDAFTILDTIGRLLHADKMDEGYTRGFICFYISGGGEVHIRKVRLKHLK